MGRNSPILSVCLCVFVSIFRISVCFCLFLHLKKPQLGAVGGGGIMMVKTGGACGGDSRVLWCPSTAASGTVEQWHGNCIAYTSPWSPCSTTCGLGISTRISNVNARCWPEQESRLCNLRPCDVDIHSHIKVSLEQG